MNEVSWRDL